MWSKGREAATRERARTEAIERRAIAIMERAGCDWVEAWERARAQQAELDEQRDEARGSRLHHHHGSRVGRRSLSEQIGHAAPLHPSTVVPGRRTMSVMSVARPVAVMRRAERAEAEIDPATAELVARACGRGAPLEAALRSQLETALGADLDRVRVHTDGDADAAARALGARAFAIGDDVFFRSGAYAPDRREGQWLIAHEVAHTVQSRGAAGDAGEATTVSRPHDTPEREADAFADAFVRSVGLGREGGLGASPVGGGQGEPASARPEDGAEPDPRASLVAVSRAAPVAQAAQGAAQVYRYGDDAGPRSETVRLGPQIRPGSGTTAELQAERTRLVNEQSTYHHSTIEPDTEQVYNQYTQSIRRLDTLLAERGNSTLPDATIELAFDGRTLTMTGTSTGSWPAVSGRPDENGAFDNSPARQRQQDVGPIPAGIYWIDPREMVELQRRILYSILYEQAWGTHRITIHPFDTTQTFGRGGFFIHGGATPGSAGCIDLTGGMADFARRLGVTPPGAKVKITVAY